MGPGEAEADVVDPVRWRAPITVRRAQERRVIVIRPAPDETMGLFVNEFKHIYNITARYASRRVGPVVAPFMHITQHVEQAQIVGEQASALPGMLLTVG